MRIAKYIPVALTVALCAGVFSYAVGDAYDVVPGILTIKPFTEQHQIPQLATSMATVELPTPEASASSKINQEKLKEARKVLAEHAQAAGGRLGINVIDAHTGKEVFSDHPEVPMTPASNTKLFTTYTALRLLNPEDTFVTSTALAGNTVFLKSNGDITLGSGKTDPNAVMGHAGLETLAHETAQALRGKVSSVKIAVDESALSGPQRNPIWKDQDIESYTGSVVTMAIQQGRQNPAVPRHFSETPVMDAAKVFAQKLQAEGVTVEGEPESKPQTPGATPLAEVKSAPYSELLRYLEKTSDNTLAEHFCRVMSKQLGANADFNSPAGQIVKQFEQRGLDMSGVSLNDCSGLDNRNLVTPSALTQIIRDTLDEPKISRQMVLSDFPVSGWDGTLRKRYHGTGAAGLIRAKTGLLPGVRSLAGVTTTKSGQDLIFAVMVDNCDPEKSWGMKDRIDDFMSVLVNN